MSDLASAESRADGNQTGSIAVVIIGRNEGQRLVRGLASAREKGARVVYVDSGSTDGSVVAARTAGADVVELDMSKPFSAARARNAGFQTLSDQTPPPEMVQFLDGDCILADGWLESAQETLAKEPSLAVVVGWLTELHPERSVYNAMCALEWKKPAGPIVACGGIMMVRYSAFQGVGGFDETVIAAEDDEFCLRLAQAGWDLICLPVEMAQHDAAMNRFGQWWRRAVRAGHGFAQVGALHPGYFRRPRWRAFFWAAGLPAVSVISLVFWRPGLILVVAAYSASYLRNAMKLSGSGLGFGKSLHHAMFMVLSKFPNLQGIIIYHWRNFSNVTKHLIEYK